LFVPDKISPKGLSTSRQEQLLQFGGDNDDANLLITLDTHSMYPTGHLLISGSEKSGFRDRKFSQVRRIVLYRWNIFA
jgi:hypothetical protein